jgi:hypothetical protein
MLFIRHPVKDDRAGSARRKTGSRGWGATLSSIGKGLTLGDQSRRLMLSPPLLLFALIWAICGCGTTSNDLIPVETSLVPGTGVWDGTVNVQVLVLPKNANDGGRIAAWTDQEKFMTALKTALERKGLFSRMADGEADYVLDVWAYLSGKEGEQLTPVYEMDAVWRLTRVRDGMVLLCDYTHAEERSGRSIVKATKVSRDTFQYGIAHLADRSQNHMGALPATLRPSMGPVVPQVLARVKMSFPRLRGGMTLEQATALLDPDQVLNHSMNERNRLAGDAQIPDGKTSRHNFQTDGKTFSSDATDITVRDFVTVIIHDQRSPTVSKRTVEYLTDAYTLVFLNGELKKWALKETFSGIR